MAYRSICMDGEARKGPGTTGQSGFILATLVDEGMCLTGTEAPHILIHIFTGLTADASDTTVAYHDSRPRAFASGSIVHTFCGSFGAHPMRLHMPAGRTRGIPRVCVSTKVLQQRFHMQETLTPSPHMGTTCADSAT